MLPDAASGQGPGTPPEAGPESCHVAPRRSEAKSGVQGGEACPAEAKRKRGYKFDRSQKTVTVQDLNCGPMRVSGCKNHYKSVLGAGAKVEERSDETPPWRGKNRDKLITPTVRVMRSFFILLLKS